MADAPRVAPQHVLDGPLPKCRGYQQLLSAALASSVGLTVPNGATIALLQAEGDAVRWRADEVAPSSSVGMLISDGGEVLYVASESALAALRFIRTTSSSILNVSFYG